MTAQTSPRYAHLDALRGLAILGVMLVHSGFTEQAPHFLHPLLYSGARGVQLFFVVSAFTLLSSWNVRADRGEPETYASFLTRRFFRLAPMYYIGLGLTFYHSGFGPRGSAPDGIGWGHILSNIFFVHSWWPTAINSVVDGGWSIGDEMMFYLAVPLIVTFVRKPSTAMLVMLGATVIGPLASYGYVHLIDSLIIGRARETMPLIEAFGPLSQFGVFCGGVFAYRLLGDWQRARRLIPSWLSDKILGAAALPLFGLAYFVAVYAYLPPWSFGIIFAPLVCGLTFYPTRLLVNRPMVWLGRVSYSVYVLHFTAIGFISPAMAGFSPFIVFPITVVASTAAASLTYLAIERPFMALGERLGKKLEARGSAMLPATEGSRGG
jgi:peptidoglycan/LPS O-acetylase OafA/YrhL